MVWQAAPVLKTRGEGAPSGGGREGQRRHGQQPARPPAPPPWQPRPRAGRAVEQPWIGGQGRVEGPALAGTLAPCRLDGGAERAEGSSAGRMRDRCPIHPGTERQCGVKGGGTRGERRSCGCRSRCHQAPTPTSLSVMAAQAEGSTRWGSLGPRGRVGSKGVALAGTAGQPWLEGGEGYKRAGMRLAGSAGGRLRPAFGRLRCPHPFQSSCRWQIITCVCAAHHLCK